MNVFLTWSMGFEFEPNADLCPNSFGVMEWTIRSKETGIGIGDLDASRCDNRLQWTARHIVEDPVEIARVVAVGYAEALVTSWDLYTGAAEALSKIGMTLWYHVPVGRIYRPADKETYPDRYPQEWRDGAHS